MEKDGGVEQLAVFAARHVDRTEARQMRRHELRVQQAKAAGAQPRYEMDQRDLRGIALDVEHAFAEERRPETHAVESADKLAVAPGLDRMGVADVEQFAVERADA